MHVYCPGCGREIPVADHEIGTLTITCAVCETRFVAQHAAPVEAPEPRHSSFTRPFCGSTWPPVPRRRTSTAGWALFGVSLTTIVLISAFGLACFPLCFAIAFAPLSVLGLLMKETHGVCSDRGAPVT
jgi:hypothetical protein